VVGYDPPLGTFFAQVIDPTRPEDDERHVPLWVGTDVKEIISVAALVTALHDWAVIPEPITTQLATDQQTQGFRPNFGLAFVRHETPRRKEEPS
jgi:hypothetical protein